MHSLQKAALGNASKREACLVQRFGTLGGGTNAHRWKWAPNTREKARLLGQSAGIANHRISVHLQAVIVVEAHRLMHANPRVQLEARGLQTLARTRVAAVQDWHVVLLSQGVDGGEQAREVCLSVDILLAMRREQHVALRFQTKLGKNVRCFNFVEISTKHLGHRATRDISTLRSATRVFEIAASVLGICQIDIRNHIDNATVGLLGQTFVFAAIARLHMENRNMQALCANSGQAAIGVAQNQQRIRPHLRHELVTGSNDIANGLAQILPHSIQVDVRIIQAQVAEENAVERVIIVLPSVCQQAIEMTAAFLDDLR